MGKKGHLTFKKGHLIFGWGAFSPHARPQIGTVVVCSPRAKVANFKCLSLKSVIKFLVFLYKVYKVV